jgi:type 1 glutamine amidotransferase
MFSWTKGPTIPHAQLTSSPPSLTAMLISRQTQAMKQSICTTAMILWITATACAQGNLKVLVFSATAGYRHASITNGIALIEALGGTNNFSVDATEDASKFTDVNLAQYKVVVFLNTTGDVLTNSSEMSALQHFIEAGGGWVGVHAASDTFHQWSWYGALVGAYFVGHPGIQPATLRVEDRNDPSTFMLPAAWVRTDEWYDFDHNPRATVHVLATIDPSTYFGSSMGAVHPLIWSHYFDGGRAWYSACGHTPESYSEPLFQANLLGGILFAAGVAAGHPPLAFTSASGNVVLSWPAGASGFVAETATNLQSSMTWTAVTNSESIQNGIVTVALPQSASQQFVRLRK